MGNVTISCQCGKKYSVPEATIGKKGKCKSCGEIFTAKIDEEVVEFSAEAAPSVPVSTPPRFCIKHA